MEIRTMDAPTKEKGPEGPFQFIVTRPLLTMCYLRNQTAHRP